MIVWTDYVDLETSVRLRTVSVKYWRSIGMGLIRSKLSLENLVKRNCEHEIRLLTRRPLPWTHSNSVAIVLAAGPSCHIIILKMLVISARHWLTEFCISSGPDNYQVYRLALSTAVVTNQFNKVQFLCELWSKTNDDWDVFEWAFFDSCRWGYLEIVQILVNSTCVDSFGLDYFVDSLLSSGLKIASKAGHVSLVEYLIWLKPKRDGYLLAILKASCHGHLDIVKILSKQEVFASYRGPLIKASKHGHLDVICFLSSLTEVTEEDIMEAIATASLRGHMTVVKYLTKLPNIDYKNPIIHDALYFAVSRGHTDIATYLLDVNTFAD